MSHPFGALRVSVVIPTIGRESLAAAVRSALDQTRPPVEIVVVFDGPAGDAPAIEGSPQTTVVVLATGGGAGPNVARNRGVAAASGDVIALLDDDDVWEPRKLQTQLDEVGAPADLRWVSTSAVRTRGRGASEVWPSAGPARDEPIADYLFVRSLRRRHPFLQTSTWLIPRALLLEVPLREDLENSLFDDFDWLIRGQAEHDIRVLFSAEPLTTYTVMNSDSFASRTAWQDCLGWILDPSLPVGRRARADFLLGIPFRLALRRDGRREAVVVVRSALRAGRPTALALLVAVAKLVRGR